MLGPFHSSIFLSGMEVVIKNKYSKKQTNKQTKTKTNNKQQQQKKSKKTKTKTKNILSQPVICSLAELKNC